MLKAKWRASMNVSDYFTGTFLKVEDLAGEVMHATIEKVEEGKYGLVLTLDNDSMFSLNMTNGKTLAKAYSYESDNWCGKRIELSAGEVPYKGDKVPSIILKPISPPLSESDRKLPEPDISDDIPF
jgi:hypothetical protein